MLLRFANKIQQNEHERQERLSKEQAEKDVREGKAEDGVEIVDEEVETTGWGAGVRRRQKLEQARLKRLAEQEAEAGDMGEDKELEGLLED